MIQLKRAAAKANGTTCGYAFYGPLRVKNSERGFQFYIHHIEVNEAYAAWFVQYGVY